MKSVPGLHIVCADDTGERPNRAGSVKEWVLLDLVFARSACGECRKEFLKKQFSILFVYDAFTDEAPDGNRTSDKTEDTADTYNDAIIQRFHAHEIR